VTVVVWGAALVIPYMPSITSASTSATARAIELRLVKYCIVPSEKIRRAFRVGRLGGSSSLGCCTSRGLDASASAPRVGGRDIGHRAFLRRLGTQLTVNHVN